MIVIFTVMINFYKLSGDTNFDIRQMMLKSQDRKFDASQEVRIYKTSE